LLYIHYDIHNGPTPESAKPAGFHEELSLTIEIPDDLSQTELEEIQKFFSADLRARLMESGCTKQKMDLSTGDAFQARILTELPAGKQSKQLSHYYRYNSWVKIREEVFDSVLRIQIGDFIGKILDFYGGDKEDIFYVQWSAQSLVKITDQNLMKCIAKKISPFGTYIGSELLIPIQFAEEPGTTEKQRKEMLTPTFLKKYENEFNQVFNNSASSSEFSYQTWEDYLTKLLASKEPITVLHNKINYQMTGIAGSDEKNGVWVELTDTEHTLIMPLNEIRKVSAPQKISKIFSFYNYWSVFFCRD
jgi:hypothetical protein